jgi:hypothetical protein
MFESGDIACELRTDVSPVGEEDEGCGEAEAAISIGGRGPWGEAQEGGGRV